MYREEIFLMIASLGLLDEWMPVLSASCKNLKWDHGFF